MAIILLLYFIAVIIFFSVGLVGIFHAVKYKMPGDNALGGTYIFIGVSWFILILSLIFIFRADWSERPKFLESFKGLTEKGQE